MRRGGNIAWGIVPTSDLEVISTETADSLADRWISRVREFVSGEMSVADVLRQSIFTPSCGLGSLPEEAANKVLELLTGFSRIIEKTKP